MDKWSALVACVVIICITILLVVIENAQSQRIVEKEKTHQLELQLELKK